MTVGTLKKHLENLSDDAIVYISNPDNNDDPHWNLGARYLVSNGSGAVWFETYSDENIEEEIDAIAEVASEEEWDEWDFYDELFGKDKHGYTLDDIKRACPDRYEACKQYLETHAI